MLYIHFFSRLFSCNILKRAALLNFQRNVVLHTKYVLFHVSIISLLINYLLLLSYSIRWEYCTVFISKNSIFHEVFSKYLVNKPSVLLTVRPLFPCVTIFAYKFKFPFYDKIKFFVHFFYAFQMLIALKIFCTVYSFVAAFSSAVSCIPKSIFNFPISVQHLNLFLAVQ